jgi:hypothetical protein
VIVESVWVRGEGIENKMGRERGRVEGEGRELKSRSSMT